jgi:tetratricopeptide (TPR) repeat protein
VALIERIVSEARSEYDRRADHALELLNLAVGVANTLKDPLALALQRATIAKERANALRMLSRYPEALDELDWAERFMDQLPIRAFDLALIEWARATVLFYRTRYAEALPLVRRAAKILRQFGEIPRAQQAGLLEAGIVFEMGDAAAALAMNERLATYFERGNLARVIGNMASCEVLLDRPEQARRHAARAMQLYDELGKPTERTRVESTLGNLYMRQGQFAEARTRLLAAAAFQALGNGGTGGGVAAGKPARRSPRRACPRRPPTRKWRRTGPGPPPSGG